MVLVHPPRIRAFLLPAKEYGKCKYKIAQSGEARPTKPPIASGRRKPPFSMRLPPGARPMAVERRNPHNEVRRATAFLFSRNQNKHHGMEKNKNGIPERNFE